MLNKITVNALLKSVIVTLAVAVVIVLSISAWNSWTRLAAVNRIAAVANASGDLFRALHNLRVDRATTIRELNSEDKHGVAGILKDVRDAEIPALFSGLKALEAADFPEKQSAIAKLTEAAQKLTALQKQTADALALAKAQRPQGLAQEFSSEASGLLQLIETISMQLNKSVKLEDAYIDQLFSMKQLAWVARNTAGDASVIISNTMSGLPLPPDAMQQYLVHSGKLETAWSAMQDIGAGMQLPANVTAAIAKGNEYFAPDYVNLRMNTLKTLIAGGKIDMPPAEWTRMSVAKLATLLGVAEAALDATKDYTAAQRADATFKLTVELGLLIGAIALVTMMMVLVSRRVTGPLLQIQQAMAKVAEGDFSVVLPGLERKDEIGKVSNAVERFKTLADEKARAEAGEAVKRQQAEADRQAQLGRAEADAQAKVTEERAKEAAEQKRAVEALGVGLVQLSHGDLSFRLTDRFPDAYVELKDNFNSTMTQLQETIAALSQAANEVTGASAEISTATTDLSQRTEEQAASLEETTSSMEQISDTVKKNAENAQAANSSAASTQTVADRGGQVVAKAVQAMAKIEESSRKIGDIIGVIDEIARQTNLLALNAAVEAARAGEAGRGFAVVASEVRSLAQRSSQAAKDIKDLITNSNSQVKDGVDLVNKAGAALTEIVQSIKSVASIVSEIANASAEQANGIEQVNKALTQMDQMTQQNSALVEENAATAKTLEHQAKAMDERVAFFKLAEAALSPRPASTKAA